MSTEMSEQNNKVKRKRTVHTHKEKETLKAIIKTAEKGKYWSAIHGETSSKSYREECWTEITDLFNAAMGTNYTKKVVRDMYNKLKTKDKENHDNMKISAGRKANKLKSLCSKTGGGPGPEIGELTDPDISGSIFSQELDPVATPFNQFTKPVAASAKNVWSGDFLMTNLDGSPIINSMGEPVPEISKSAWCCRGVMPSGKLCPRVGQDNCPLHGALVPRDEMGNPNGRDKENLPPNSPIHQSTPVSSINKPTKKVDNSKVTAFQPPTIANLRNNVNQEKTASHPAGTPASVTGYSGSQPHLKGTAAPSCSQSHLQGTATPGF